MTRLVLSLLAIVAFQTFCYADVTKLPVDDQKVLRDVSRFHEIHTATNLPATVFALCADGAGRLAESVAGVDTAFMFWLPSSRLARASRVLSGAASEYSSELFARFLMPSPATS